MPIFTKRTSKLEQAQQWYQKAIDLDGSRIGGYLAKGYAYLEEENEKRYDQARIAFQQAIEIAPQAFDGYWGMAWAYEQQEQWQGALHYYEESLPHRPGMGGDDPGKNRRNEIET